MQGTIRSLLSVVQSNGKAACFCRLATNATVKQYVSLVRLVLYMINNISTIVYVYVKHATFIQIWKQRSMTYVNTTDLQLKANIMKGKNPNVTKERRY